MNEEMTKVWYTGIPQIDRVTNGLTVGRLNTVVAPVGCFKTTMAINVAYNIAVNQGGKVKLAAFEDTKRNIYSRLLTLEAYSLNTNLDCTYDDESSQEETSRIVQDSIKSKLKKSGGSIDIISYGDAKYSNIKELLDNMSPADVIIIDGLECSGLFSESSDGFWTNFAGETNSMIRSFAKYARETETTILLGLQAARDGHSILEKITNRIESEKDFMPSAINFAHTVRYEELDIQTSLAITLYQNREMSEFGYLRAYITRNKKTKQTEFGQRMISGFPEVAAIKVPVQRDYGKIGLDFFDNLIDSQDELKL